MPALHPFTLLMFFKSCTQLCYTHKKIAWPNNTGNPFRHKRRLNQLPLQIRHRQSGWQDFRPFPVPYIPNRSFNLTRHNSGHKYHVYNSTVLTECLSESRKEKVPRYIDSWHRLSWTILNLDSLKSPALNKYVHEPRPPGDMDTWTWPHVLVVSLI